MPKIIFTKMGWFKIEHYEDETLAVSCNDEDIYHTLPADCSCKQAAKLLDEIYELDK